MNKKLSIEFLGNPGSGKSYVQKRLFAGTGMKVVNSDNYLTNSLKKAGQSLDLRGVEGGILDAMRGTAKRKAGNQMDLLSKLFTEEIVEKCVI